MGKILQLMAFPKTGFVDIVGWGITLLGVFGLGIGLLQLPMLLLSRPSSGYWGLWAVFTSQSGLLLFVGRGVRKRRNAARIALVSILLLGVIWNSYWLAAALLRKPLPLIPAAMVQETDFRTGVIGISIFWSLVYLWLAWKLSSTRVVREFTGQDV